MTNARRLWIVLLMAHLVIMAHPVLSVLPFPAVPLHARENLQTVVVAPEDALDHHGRIVTVCGKVAGTQYAEKIKGQPALLHLEKPYPKHVFTIVIWGADRGKFEKPPEEFYRGKDVCVTGLVVEHNGKPQIVVRNPSRLNVR